MFVECETHNARIRVCVTRHEPQFVDPEGASLPCDAVIPMRHLYSRCTLGNHVTSSCRCPERAEVIH
jgi:hypothetical protein